VQNWLNHIRRKSLRKSWPSLLAKPKHYFWMAQQLQSEISKDGDSANREKYVEFLRLLSTQLHCPEIAELALDFRRSVQRWSVVALSLLDDSFADLLTGNLSENQSKFVALDIELDVDLRLELVADSLIEILDIERNAFTALGKIVQQFRLHLASVEFLDPV